MLPMLSGAQYSWVVSSPRLSHSAAVAAWQAWRGGAPWVIAQQGSIEGIWIVAYLGDYASQWPFEFSIQVPSEHDILRKHVSFNNGGRCLVLLLSLNGPVG